MDPTDQGVGEHNAPPDQHSTEQTDPQLQHSQTQQQQQAQSLHVQQQQQAQPRSLPQPHHVTQALPDRQQYEDQHRRQILQMHHHTQYHHPRPQQHHPEVHPRYAPAGLMRIPHAQHQQQGRQPGQAGPSHVVQQQPHPTITRSGSSLMSAAPTQPTPSSTSKLWEHFIKGEKMQKTNKFLAHCVYCRKVNKDSATRGERRMMSNHLSNCPEAPPEARQEGQTIAKELKLRRSMLTRKKSAQLMGGPHGGVNVSPGGKRTRRASSLSVVGPSAAQTQDPMVVSQTHAQPDPTGTGPSTYFDPSIAPPMSLASELMRSGSITTSDNVRLYYEECGSGHPLILIHDFAGSCKYFESNFRDLAANFRVFRYDLRGHGDSEKPRYGFHLHRLAADLHDMVEHFSLERVALLGGGLGCSVMWAFVELYGQSQISALLFVDQSPYQMASMDGAWRLGSKRMFSEGTLAHMAAELKHDPRAFHEANVRACFTRPPTNVETSLYVNESLKASEDFLIKLMADQCRADFRAVLPLVNCPALVIAGKKSKIFPWQGVAFAAENMPHAKLLPFEEGSHYLYIEESMRFNSTVTAFLQSIVAGA